MPTLKRHLNAQDQADAESSAVAMLVDQWLSHPSKIQTAWKNVLGDPEQVQIIGELLTHYSLKSGRFLGFDELSAQSLLSDCMSDMLVSELNDMAYAQLMSDAEQNAVDAALED